MMSLTKASLVRITLKLAIIKNPRYRSKRVKTILDIISLYQNIPNVFTSSTFDKRLRLIQTKSKNDNEILRCTMVDIDNK